MKDDSLNILFISNSTCYYFTDELFRMLAEAGYEDANLCLVYYSGCSLQMHYEWWKSGQANYEFHITNRDGRKMLDHYSLEQALGAYAWDIISFDNNSFSFSTGNTKLSLENAEPYMRALLAEIKKVYSKSRFFWHETWANEVGYSISFKMESIEQRKRIATAMKEVSGIMQERYGVEVVPTGDAWEKIRDQELITIPPVETEMDRFTLTTRMVDGKLFDDYTHDGDLGGGRYLNACVWFEVITGQACTEISYIPVYHYLGKPYVFAHEKVKGIQKASLEAVKEWK